MLNDSLFSIELHTLDDKPTRVRSPSDTRLVLHE